MEITLGTIKGRHEMPVDKFVFDEVADVTDVAAIRKHVEEVLSKLVGASDRLVVYVTGLTLVTVEITRWASLKHVGLTFKHYDAKKHDYFDEKVF